MPRVVRLTFTAVLIPDQLTVEILVEPNPQENAQEIGDWVTGYCADLAIGADPGEVGEVTETPEAAAQAPAPSGTQPMPAEGTGVETLTCVGCGGPVTPGEKTFSLHNFTKVLCKKCQPQKNRS